MNTDQRIQIIQMSFLVVQMLYCTLLSVLGLMFIIGHLVG